MNLKKICSITLIVTLTLSRSIFAANVPQQTQLSTINKNIASIQTELKQATLKKSQLQTALEQTENTESTINNELKTTQKTLSTQQQKLKKLQKQTIPLSKEKNKNREALKQQIRVAYLFSQKPYLKLLLEPNNVAKTQQMLMYFHYITNEQTKTMAKLEKSLTSCMRNQKAIQKQYAKLLALKQTQLQNQQALQKTQTQRQQLIQAINQHIQTKHEKLVALLHNKQQLEKTITLLNQQTSQPVFSQLSPVPNLPFGRLRGKLSWPTHGSIRDAFGTQVYQSELKWDGTLISAPQGQVIHAVAAGRVIFAKWMAGYGLLLIVNQGNGYMTLYGRAQTLTKTVGDYVKANEVIGTVGKSGGFEHPALYFSIRHDGTAINPTNWCA